MKRYASRLLALARRWLNADARDRTLDAELESFFQHEMDARIASGMSPEEARRTSLASIGGIQQVKERARDARTGAWFDALWRDTRYAVRSLRRSPGLAATAIVSFAVGIAAAAGLFSLVDAALLHPFPFADSDQLVRLELADKGTTRNLFVTARQLAVLQTSEVLGGIFALNTWEMTLTGRDLAETVSAEQLSANGLDVLGVPPLLGRVFHEADGPPGEQAKRVVVLTYRFWQRDFGGRPEAVGRTLLLNREPYTVIGVLPREYFLTGPDVLVPLDLAFDTNLAWSVEARLKRGDSLRVAEERLRPLFDTFARQAPPSFPDGARPLVRGLVQTQRAADFAPILMLTFAAAMLLVLLACANVSILLLARGSFRAHEFALRAAIGASRGRLIGQLLVESLLLAFSGAALGVACGYWGLPAVLKLLPHNSVPFGNLMAVPVNGPVLLFSASLAIASALICGLSPALSLSRARLMATIGTTAGESRRAHQWLLAVQIAMTALLLAGTGAAVRGLIGLYRTPLGYDPRDLIVATINLPENSHREWAGRAEFYGRLRDRMAEVPQVQSVALATYSGIPPQSGERSVVQVPGRDTSGNEAPAVQRISATYFSTMNIPLIRGRVWSDSEGGGTPHVAVVNETMARVWWPDASAIGQRVRMPDYVKPPNPYRLAAPGSDGWFEIVGVVGDTPNVGLREPPAPSIYVPYTLMLSDSLNVILRTSRDPLAMTRSIREAVRTVDPNQPVSVYTAEGVLANAGLARERFVTVLLLGFAICALMLAVVGLYSVVSYSVSCRFKELSIRMALGGGRMRIVTATVRPAFLAVVAGLFAGLASSVGLNKIAAHWSIGNLNDPVVLLAASVVLFVVTMMSAALPASRAASIQPADAVRVD